MEIKKVKPTEAEIALGEAVGKLTILGVDLAQVVEATSRRCSSMTQGTREASELAALRGFVRARVDEIGAHLYSIGAAAHLLGGGSELELAAVEVAKVAGEAEGGT